MQWNYLRSLKIYNSQIICDDKIVPKTALDMGSNPRPPHKENTSVAQLNLILVQFEWKSYQNYVQIILNFSFILNKYSYITDLKSVAASKASAMYSTFVLDVKACLNSYIFSLFILRVHAAVITTSLGIEGSSGHRLVFRYISMLPIQMQENVKYVQTRLNRL